MIDRELEWRLGDRETLERLVAAASEEAERRAAVSMRELQRHEEGRFDLKELGKRLDTPRRPSKGD